MFTNQGITIKNQLKGCPQGSCSGPYFWNLLAEEVLNKPTNPRVHIQAFADDFLLVVNHHTREGLTRISNAALTEFKEWSDKHKLEISPEKSSYLLLGKLVTGPSIKWANTRIRRQYQMKYLGIMFDDKWKWTPHIAYLKAKCVAKHNALSQMTGPNWGLKWEFRKLLYDTVVLRMILHGASIWGHSLSVRQKNKLNSLQRPFLLNITKAYRTTPTAALQVATGTPPLYLAVEIECLKNRILKSAPTSIIIPEYLRQIPSKPTGLNRHPASFHLTSSIALNHEYVDQLNHTTYFTDGSKTDNGVGNAFCSIINNKTEVTWKGKLASYNSVFQAEISAIQQAIHNILLHEKSTTEEYTIWSDSLSSLQSILNPKTSHQQAREIQDLLHNNNRIQLKWIKAHAGHAGNEQADQLAKEATTEGTCINIPPPISHLKKFLTLHLTHQWQKDWDRGDTGRKIFNIFPKVSLLPTITKREVLQFLTEHGPFPAYLERFSLSPTDLCSCGEPGTPLHYATRCLLTSSFHITAPSPANYTKWLQNIAKKPAIQTRIINLVRFIKDNEQLLHQP